MTTGAPLLVPRVLLWIIISFSSRLASDLSFFLRIFFPRLAQPLPKVPPHSPYATLSFIYMYAKMSFAKDDKCERGEDSLPAYEESENPGLDQDAVFGEITGDGPNYRNVRSLHPQRPPTCGPLRSV